MAYFLKISGITKCNLLCQLKDYRQRLIFNFLELMDSKKFFYEKKTYEIVSVLLKF